MPREIYAVNQGCTYCATCLYECPAEAITMGMDGAVIDPERCTGCGRCARNCASEAISRVTLPRGGNPVAEADAGTT